jgi:hypothetical protein
MAANQSQRPSRYENPLRHALYSKGEGARLGRIKADGDGSRNFAGLTVHHWLGMKRLY